MAKVGVCEWSLPVWGPFSIDFAADCGFEGVQLTDLRGVYWGYPMNNRFIQEGYKEASARTGVVLQSMHLMTLSHSTGHFDKPDSPKGELARHSFRQAVKACAAMGIPVINISGVARGEGTFENLMDFLKFAIRLCKDNGILLVYERGIDMVYITNMLNEVPDLMLNYHLSEYPAFQVPTAIPEKIDHVHIMDHHTDPATGVKTGAIAGEGSKTIAEGIHLLKEKGFDNWYLSEAEYVDFTLPEDVVRGNWGRGFPEPGIDSSLHPLSFGVGSDLTEVCRKDYQAIRYLVDHI